MTKDGMKGKFLIDQNLNVETIEYNTESLEFEYTTVSRKDNKVKINIVVTDKINGIKQIDYPEEDALKVVSGTKEQISIDYEVELGQEYKFVITTGDGNKTEKIIKIDDYYYNVTKEFGENVTIDNNATKTAYNKTYETTISISDYYYIMTGLTVTMGDKTITTSGNDIVDINTGKIKIEKVTDNINIKVTTKQLVISATTPYIGTSTTVTDSSKSVSDNSQEIGTTLYINFKATLEGKACTITLKDDTNKTVPYAITTNGKYTFIATGTYSEKIITKEIEVKVNKYKSVGGFVQYDAGDWTEEEIQELKNQKLYMLNKAKTYNSTFNLNDSSTGLNFTFGGFTYKGDTTNESAISSGTIITSRNQSVASGRGTPKYSGWQILESNSNNGKIYVTKLVHAGSPENFVFAKEPLGYGGMEAPDNSDRAEYLLSGGTRRTGYNTLRDGKTKINPRNWDMYKDQKQLNLINEVHMMTYDEAAKICHSSLGRINCYYWIAAKYNTWYICYMSDNIYSSIDYYASACYGVRPVITMNDGVYIVSGNGTEENPYVLGKD